MTITLSPRQQETVSRDGNLIVRAGAGSGKTEVLARRFVALLSGDLGDQRPLEPARLAALTFTEKAALDMRQRIAAVLAERIKQTPEGALRRHLRRAERSLGLAWIATIHAFCARILRDNAVAAGLDPAFEVLDDYASIIFYERVCREVLVRGVRDGDHGALALVQARRLEDDSQREDAPEIVRRILTEARRRGDAPEAIQAQTARTANRLGDGGDRVTPLAEAFAGLIDNLLKTKGVSGAAEEKLRELGGLWRTAQRTVRGLNRGSEPSDLEILREILVAMPDARSSKVRGFVNEARQLVEKGDRKYGLEGKLIATWGEYRGIEAACPVARLIVATGRAIEDAERSFGVMTFDGLLIGVRDLLRANPPIVDRYRRELRVLLVDEYQDTNSIQDEIIRLLTDPEGASDADLPQLFIVGDEKQSIYRFRGADVSVFNRPRHAEEIGLTENRRSTPNLLAFANGVAKEAMKVPSEPRDYRTVWSEKHELRPLRQVAIDYPVEVITQIDNQDETSDERLDASRKRSREGTMIGRRIQQIIAHGEPIIDPETDAARPARYRDCVILMRAFGDIAIYEEAFAAVGVPTYTVKGRGFYGRPEVKDLISLLNAIADPRDALALATVLRSPFFALSDDGLMQMGLYLHRSEGPNRPTSIADLFQQSDFSWLTNDRAEAAKAAAILRQLQASRDREPAHVIVERCLELTDYESVMAGLPQGDQRIANLRKVMEIARSFATHRFFTFRDFVGYLKRLVEDEPYEPQAQIPGEDDDVVRLMTVHQAKGLEFPIVIIADAGRKPPPNNVTPQLDPAYGLLMCATDGSGYDEIPNAALERYREQLKDEEKAESARILYVALTRARDRLMISEGADRHGWVEYLRAFLGEQVLAGLGPRDAIEFDRGGARILLRRPTSIDAAERPVSTTGARAGDIGLALQAPAPARLAASGERVISPTALADFERCPRQYWLRHGLGLPERRGSEAGGEADALAMGSVAHAVLERIQFGLEGEATRAQIAELAAISGTRAGLTKEQCTAIGRDLARYVATTDRSEEILGREVPFMLNATPGLFIRGQIDAVLRRAATIIVRDYKYAAKGDAAQYQIQLECYALAVAERFPTSRIETQLAMLREEPCVIAMPTGSANAIRAKIAQLADQLAQASRTSDYRKGPQDPSVCKTLRCGYRDRCWKKSG